MKVPRNKVVNEKSEEVRRLEEFKCRPEPPKGHPATEHRPVEQVRQRVFF
jgi:hypothetical protein